MHGVVVAGHGMVVAGHGVVVAGHGVVDAEYSAVVAGPRGDGRDLGVGPAVRGQTTSSAIPALQCVCVCVCVCVAVAT